MLQSGRKNEHLHLQVARIGRWIGYVQLMVHIWILTSIILNLDVIRFSLVCCSRYRCVYFHTPVLVLLSGDPAGGNVSGHLPQTVTLWITVNRLNISSRCHVFRRPCRWPFVIGPSVLKSQQSITANRDRNRLFNQIISRALRVCLSDACSRKSLNKRHDRCGHCEGPFEICVQVLWYEPGGAQPASLWF